MERKKKYKTGDRVRILIGHEMWIMEELVNGEIVRLDKPRVIDISQEIVGKLATVIKSIIIQDKESVSLNIDGEGFRAWFSMHQIEEV